MISSKKTNNKNKFILITLLIVTLFGSVYLYDLNFGEQTKNPKEHQLELAKELDTSGTDNHYGNKDKVQLDKSYSSDVYDSSAIMIDKEFRERFENQFPVVTVHKLENEFQNKVDINNYLNTVLDDIESHTLESLEIANLCGNKTQVLSSVRKQKNEKLKLYYEVLFQKCEKVTWENDIFYVVEKMALSGDKFEQLNYLNNLNSAIHRGVIKPMVKPYEYIEKRELAIGWLQQLASKGVVTAYEILANLYRSGYNVERDNVLAYYYASKAAENALVTDYGDVYLNRLKSKMNDIELDRLNRMLKKK